jgi:hypothetical protein
MMQNDFGMYEYWHLLRTVTAYSVDLDPEVRLTIPGKAAGALDEAEFYESLYVLRDEGHFEAALIRELLHGSSAICLTAGPGAGKTSALRFSLRQLQNMNLPYRIVSLDIARCFSSSILQDVSRPGGRAAITDFLRRHVLSVLFPSWRELDVLVAWCLAGPPDDSDPFHYALTAEFHDVFAKAGHLGVPDTPNRRSRTEALATMLLESKATLGEIPTLVLERIRLPHMIQAAISIPGGISRLVFAVDNIDRLPTEAQRVLFSDLIDTQRAVGGSLALVFAIRREGLQSLLREPGEGGYVPTFLTSAVGPTSLLPRTRGRDMYKVLAQRINYVDALCGLAAGEAGAATSVGASVSGVASRLSELTARGIVRIALHRLSNGNLRATMALYLEYLRFLEGCGAVPDQEMSMESPSVDTLLYLFLRRCGADYGLRFFENVYPDVSSSASASFHDCVPVPYAVLVALLNLQLGGGSGADRRSSPRLGDLMDGLGELSYPSKAVVEAVAMLSFSGGASGAEIEVLEGAAEDIAAGRPDVRIQLTEKGQELISKLYWKVGFFWLTAAMRKGSGSEDPVAMYLRLGIEQRARLVHEFLVERADTELRLAAIVGRQWRSVFGRGWMQRYRQRMGIGKALPVEMMLGSAHTFWGRTLRHDPFEDLAAEYRQKLSMVEETEDAPTSLVTARCFRTD